MILEDLETHTHVCFTVVSFLEVRSPGELNWVGSFGSHKFEIRGWQGCGPYWRPWGRICSQAHPRCWPDPAPGGYRTEGLGSLPAAS